MVAVGCSDTICLAAAILHCVTFHNTLLSPIPFVNTYRLACVIKSNMQNMILIRSEIVGNSTGYHVVQWFPTSGREPNQGHRGSDLGLREGFMKNSINMDLSSFICKQIICLTSTRGSYLNKHLFLARFVYLILSAKYWTWQKHLEFNICF